ncbi:hypothetical protein C8Q80DRAFT_334972 [Daedaleopsis nitida]|nr:hypothetical protein C8Q80DRAFT_334972 [Daedaleopsis nitida]
MDRQSRPPEITDLIIDHVGSARDTTSYDPYAYYALLRHLCLVCAQCLPRAQYFLYSVIHITRTATPNTPSCVSLLWRTLHQKPYLAGYVKKIYMFPSQYGGLLPFIIPRGDLLISLHTITVSDVEWKYPPRYNFARFTAVTCVRLHRVEFPTATDMFNLIWSLPRLVVLTLQGVTVQQHVVTEEFQQLCAAAVRLPRASGKLIDLTISSEIVSQELFPPPGAFGRSLRSLTVRPVPWACWDEAMLRQCLACMSTLQELEIEVRLGGEGTTQTRDFPRSLLSVLPSSLVRSLRLHLVPTRLAPMGYNSSRRGMIEAFTGDDESKSNPPIALFTSLRELKISLMDSGDTYDSVWWLVSIKDRLPSPLRDVLDVSIHISHVPHLWSPESEPSSEDFSDDISRLKEILHYKRKDWRISIDRPQFAETLRLDNKRPPVALPKTQPIMFAIQQTQSALYTLQTLAGMVDEQMKGFGFFHKTCMLAPAWQAIYQRFNRLLKDSHAVSLATLAEMQEFPRMLHRFDDLNIPQQRYGEVLKYLDKLDLELVANKETEIPKYSVDDSQHKC